LTARAAARASFGAANGMPKIHGFAQAEEFAMNRLMIGRTNTGGSLAMPGWRTKQDFRQPRPGALR
jgi:hypothetical protein